MRRDIIMHKYTLPFKTGTQKFVPCKEGLVHKIAVVNTIQFNSFIDFEWFDNGLVDSSVAYHLTNASLLRSFSH